MLNVDGQAIVGDAWTENVWSYGFNPNLFTGPKLNDFKINLYLCFVAVYA
ncbi:unnamed protein product, partial [Allacma fusca]